MEDPLDFEEFDKTVANVLGRISAPVKVLPEYQPEEFDPTAQSQSVPVAVPPLLDALGTEAPGEEPESLDRPWGWVRFENWSFPVSLVQFVYMDEKYHTKDRRHKWWIAVHLMDGYERGWWTETEREAVEKVNEANLKIQLAQEEARLFSNNGIPRARAFRTRKAQQGDTS